MTYRERRERRADRLRGWADKREQKATTDLRTAHQMADAIPFGQPILVGHHSETRDRNYRARIEGKYRAAFENHQKAGAMSSKADEIDRQAGNAIYSDDHDAVEQLEARIATLEAQRARIKAINVAVRKHGLQRLIQADPPFALTDGEKREFLTLMRLCPYHQVDTKGMPAYALSNLGGNISRQRARLAQLRDVAAQRARVAAVLAAEQEAP